jgi:hypothetical protein
MGMPLRGARRGGTMPFVDAEEAETRLTVSIRRDGEAINGAVQREQGERRPFWGWLELIAALEAAREAKEDPPARDTVTP